jgi:hypothetical protein
LKLPAASLGGGGDGDGSLVAAAVVINTDDTVLGVLPPRLAPQTLTS